MLIMTKQQNEIMYSKNKKCIGAVNFPSNFDSQVVKQKIQTYSYKKQNNVKILKQSRKNVITMLFEES